MKWKGRFLKRPVTRERVMRLLNYMAHRVTTRVGKPDGLTGRAMVLLNRLLYEENQ